MGQEGRYRRTSSPNTSRLEAGQLDASAATTGGDQQKVTAKEKFHQSLLRGVSPVGREPDLPPEPPTAPIQPSTDSANTGRNI